MWNRFLKNLEKSYEWELTTKLKSLATKGLDIEFECEINSVDYEKILWNDKWSEWNGRNIAKNWQSSKRMAEQPKVMKDWVHL